MKIENANVAMIGESTKVQGFRLTQSVVSASELEQQRESEEAGLEASISKEGKQSLEAMKQPVQVEPYYIKYDPKAEKDFRIRLLERMMETLMGRRFRFFQFEGFGGQQQRQVQMLGQAGTQGRSTNAANQLYIQRTAEYYEKETVSFAMKAHVNTSDGRTIDVELNLNMSREFYAANQTTIAAVRKDPLVINFDAPSAALSSRKFEFDIDSDGQPDQISQLMAGSGYLAVDWDGSGTVKDGSQLFGTQNGDGFKDLAQYDTDGNGWIDESDEIFDKLRIWAKDENGSDYLFALGEKGIGAIYLGSVATAFDLVDDRQTNGILQRTGFFLREDGTAGTVQHVDLLV